MEIRKTVKNNTGAKIEKGEAVYFNKIGEVRKIDTSKFKVGDKLYLDPDKPGAFITRSKQNMKADAWTAGLMFLGNFLMIYFWDKFPNNAPYDIMLYIFALAGWVFLFRVIFYKLENDKSDN